MAAITLNQSSLKLHTKVGTTDSGRDRIRTVTLGDINSSASADDLLNLSQSLGGLIEAPVVKVERVDASNVE